MSRAATARKAATTQSSPPNKPNNTAPAQHVQPLAIKDGIKVIEKTLADGARRAGVPVAALGHLPPAVVNAAILGKDGYQLILLDRIDPDPFNRDFEDDEEFSELVESVRIHGVLQPIMVRPVPRDAGDASEEMLPRYMIIMGERRFRASCRVGCKEIPCIIRGDLDEKTVEEYRLIENLQRKGFKPLQEARGLKRLMDLGATMDDLVKRLNRSQASIYNRLKLIELPESILKQVEAGKISASHADLIVRVENPEIQARLTKEIVTPKQEWVNGKAVEREVSFREAKVLADAAQEEAGREARWQEATVKYRQDGCMVLSISASERVFQRYSDRCTASYVRGSDVCPNDERGWTWSKLMAVIPAAPKKIVARDGNGKPVVVFPAKGAMKALRDSGIKLVTVKDQQVNTAAIEKRKEEERKAKLLIEEEGARRRVAPVIAAIEVREPNAAMWRFIADRLAEDADIEQILIRRGIAWDEKKHKAKDKALLAFIERSDGKVLKGLVVELLLWKWNRLNDDLVKRAAALVNVKLQTSVKGRP
ncbi:MAG: ParB/RepB/Spo0J family partition protein [Chthoniobacteraceae bacterium]